MPSPVSAFGGGYKRSVKPDLIFNGGKSFFREKIGKKTAVYEINELQQKAGIQTAAPSSDGNLGKVSYSHGTSNATALVSRNAAICHDVLLDVLTE